MPDPRFDGRTGIVVFAARLPPILPGKVGAGTAGRLEEIGFGAVCGALFPGGPFGSMVSEVMKNEGDGG